MDVVVFDPDWLQFILFVGRIFSNSLHTVPIRNSPLNQKINRRILVFLLHLGVVITFYTFPVSEIFVFVFHGFRYRVVQPRIEAWDGLVHSLSAL